MLCKHAREDAHAAGDNMCTPLTITRQHGHACCTPSICGAYLRPGDGRGWASTSGLTQPPCSATVIITAHKNRKNTRMNCSFTYFFHQPPIFKKGSISITLDELYICRDKLINDGDGWILCQTLTHAKDTYSRGGELSSKFCSQQFFCNCAICHLASIPAEIRARVQRLRFQILFITPPVLRSTYTV